MSKDEQAKLSSTMNKVNRNLGWKIAMFKDTWDATLLKTGKNYKLTQLKKLTDPSVLYRLPDSFL